jgi:plastocyanin
MFRTAALIASLTLAGWLLSASAATTAAPHATTRTHAVHVIVIDKMHYGPMPTNVHAGDVIEWVNHDIFEHSATARDGHFDLDLKPGATGRMTVVAGTTVFFCKFHPGMTGTVVVN